MLKRPRLACSFCGKNETEVAKLVARAKTYICDEWPMSTAIAYYGFIGPSSGVGS